MRKHAPLIGISLLLCALLLTPIVLAQSSADFELRWHVIASGGGRSTSPDFVVSGSIGQAATNSLSSADFTLQGGFWYGVGAAVGPPPTPVTGPYQLYLPVVMKNFV